MLIGFWGERIMGNVPLNKAETVYAGKDVNPEQLKQLHAASVENVIGITGKDNIIRGYYLSQLESRPDIMDEIGKEFFQKYPDAKIDGKDALEIVRIQLDVVNNYNSAVEAWRSDTNQPGRNPRPDQLMKWAVESEMNRQKTENKGPFSDLTNTLDKKDLINWSSFLVEEQQALLFRDRVPEAPSKAQPNVLVNKTHEFEETLFNYQSMVTQRDTETGNKPGKHKLDGPIKVANDQVMSKARALTPETQSMYFEFNVPDSILLDKNNNPVGTMEIKCYTPDEVQQWVEALNYVDRDDKTDKVAYGKTGLQVYTASPEDGSVGMMLGFNPDGYTTFLNMISNVRPSEMHVQAMGGDLVVLRLTNEVPDELIEQLGNSIQKQGYTNIVIQKVGVEQDEIAHIAQQMTKRDFASKPGIPAADPLYDKLANINNWEL
jgi:hypothetical protein